MNSLAAIIRTAHACIAALIAPSLLMFAFTGALQLFDLQKAQGAYRPPELIQKLVEVHKNQRFALRPQRAQQSQRQQQGRAAREGDRRAEGESQHVEPVKVIALKWAFFAVGVGVIMSTLLGLWMALTHVRRKGVLLALLAIGTVIPVVLLFP